MASHILAFHLWPAVALSPHPPFHTGITGVGIPDSYLWVLVLAQKRQRETQLHLLAALLTEPQPNWKLLSRMVLCVDSKALEIWSGWNMLIIPHELELVIKKSHLSMTLNSTILKMSLSFRTRQTPTIFVMTITPAQIWRKIGKYLINDKHKNKNILKGHKNSMKGKIQ